tara:strand:- start:331 stop:1212 length:882 start_codon:yes stop_codon:yes gene_type:complete
MKVSMKKLRLYGVEHSPWVLGVWYSLRYLGFNTSLSSLPISAKWVKNNGITFPVLNIDDKKIISDSFNIYQFLSTENHSLPYPNTSMDFQNGLEKLFLTYSPKRASFGKDLSFFKGWMSMNEYPQSLAGSFARGFLFFYYYSLIKIALVAMFLKNKHFTSLKRIQKILLNYDEKLKESKWIGGEQLSYLDFALFGHIECMCSGPTDELIPIIKKYSNLVSWIDRMIQLNDGMRPLFSRKISENNFSLDRTLANEVTFCSSIIFWASIFPITLFLIILLFVCRKNGNHFSGARL